jgi:multidrug efflux system membrane fusion protein
VNPHQEKNEPGQRDRQRASTRRAPKLILAILLGACLVGGVYAVSGKRAKPVSSAAVPVSVGVAVRRDLPIWLSAVGTVRALNTVDVKVRVDGQLQRVAFTEGQEVLAGTLLAQIDPRPFKAQLQLAQSNRQKDQASLDNTRVDVVRYEKLAEIGAGTGQNLDTSKAQMAALQAAVAGDLAQIETARLQLAYTAIAAPISGRLGMREADAGAMVHATDTTGLVTITQMQPITVLFSLPQDMLGAVVGEQGKGTLQVVVDGRDNNKQLARGKLVFIDSQVDQTNGQIRLKAAFTNEDRALWPGQLVTARLLLRTDRDVLVVPSRAIGMGQNGSYVYVVKPDHSVNVRLVNTGASVDGFTEIKSGLEASEQIVFDGQGRLSEGATVKAVSTATTADARSAVAAAAKGQ